MFRTVEMPFVREAIVQKKVMKVEVPTMKAETLMLLTRYAAYLGTRFMNPFKLSHIVILHFTQ